MGGWGFGVNWRGPDADYYTGLAQLPERAALAAELGCYRTTTVVGPASNDMTYQENWDFSVKRLRGVAEILKDHGHATRTGVHRTRNEPERFSSTSSPIQWMRC